MGAIRQVEAHYAEGGNWLESGLQGTQQAQRDLAAGQIDTLAVFLWAGLLHYAPDLTPEQTLALLDEATPAELALLPLHVQGALAASFPDKPEEEQGGGKPWDWAMAIAVWVTEWGRSEAEFWATTFRTFAMMSDGRARLYESAKKGEDGVVQSQAEGFTLEQLLTMGRRGR